MGNARTDPNGLPLHNPKSANGHGPDYCDECSYAAHDYVLWPCIGSMADDAAPPVSAAPVVPPEPSLAYCYTCAHLLSAHVPGKRHCVYCDSPDPWKNPYYPKANAGSPVVPAATDGHYCCDAPVHPHWGSVAPAATDEPALAVIRVALRADGIDDDEDATSMSVTVVAALEANGYVVLPRPEFDALTAALHKWSCGSEGHSLDCQRAVLLLRL